MDDRTRTTLQYVIAELSRAEDVDSARSDISGDAMTLVLDELQEPLPGRATSMLARFLNTRSGI